VVSALALLLVTLMIAPCRVPLLLIATALAGCAVVPPTRGSAELGPAAVTADARRFQGQRVEWGGQVVAVHNLRNRTELEVLAYPLAASGRPSMAGTPMGRFIAVRGGFLEPADFAPGRLVTVSGLVGPPREGSVGEAHYLFATVSAEDLRLWSDDYPPSGVVPFGTIGIGVGSGGFYGGGVGIGLGF
jgi:outer membrane lipoprotein